jgi:hypothetical protein
MRSIEAAVVKSQGRKPVVVFTRSATAMPPERRGPPAFMDERRAFAKSQAMNGRSGVTRPKPAGTQPLTAAKPQSRMIAMLREKSGQEARSGFHPKRKQPAARTLRLAAFMDERTYTAWAGCA